jgi:hypothetical protein
MMKKKPTSFSKPSAEQNMELFNFQQAAGQHNVVSKTVSTFLMVIL